MGGNWGFEEVKTQLAAAEMENSLQAGDPETYHSPFDISQSLIRLLTFKRPLCLNHSSLSMLLKVNIGCAGTLCQAPFLALGDQGRVGKTQPQPIKNLEEDQG